MVVYASPPLSDSMYLSLSPRPCAALWASRCPPLPFLPLFLPLSSPLPPRLALSPFPLPFLFPPPSPFLPFSLSPSIPLLLAILTAFRVGGGSAGATSVTVRSRRCAPAFAWRLGFRRTVTEVAQPRWAARAQRPDCRQHLSYSGLAAMACRCAAAKSRNWMCAAPPAATAKPRIECAPPLRHEPPPFFFLGLTPVYMYSF
jgi:hypothetical protein